jgi:hypothetical protein
MLLLVFLIIIILYLVISGKGGTSQYKFIAALTGVILVSYITGFPQGLWKAEQTEQTGQTEQTEYMEEPRKITNSVVSDDGHLLIDTDDVSLSQYGNIGTSSDVDTLFQRHTDLDMTNVAPDDLDNSDFVQDSMQKGSSIFQPNTAQGVTASQAAYHSNFKLAQPGLYMEYSVPINPRGYTADEALARKQQHRADINKKAIDGAVRSTRNIYERFFQNELNENENTEWWSAEAAEFETDFRPYY